MSSSKGKFIQKKIADNGENIAHSLQKEQKKSIENSFKNDSNKKN